MEEPVVIWVEHIEKSVYSCSWYIWQGQFCTSKANSCSCYRGGYVVAGGIKNLHNYGYQVSFEWEFR